MIFQDETSTPSFGETLLERVIRYLNYPFVNQKEFRISVLSLLLLVLIILIATLVSRYARRFLQHRVLPKFHLGSGLQYTLLRLVHYVIIVIGVLYAVKVGFSVDLTSIAVILGFLSVGIGFGLQYIAADIASGFILLFERPVRVGDWVKLEDHVEGRVENISLRSTVVVTNENLAVIVPNSKLTQHRFVNYSYGRGRVVRLNIPIVVTTGSDMEKVSAALLEAAHSVEEVLETPEPQVNFHAFGDSGLELEIRVWINEPRKQPLVRSNVNFAIDRALRKYGIEVANPQRDLHLRSGSIRLLGDGIAADRLEVASEQSER